MKEYIRERVCILRQMCIWGQLSEEEKARLKHARTEIQVDNIMREYRRQYL